MHSLIKISGYEGYIGIEYKGENIEEEEEEEEN